MESDELRQYRPRIAERINRMIYCHHCRTMGYMDLLGFNVWKVSVFCCERCQQLVKIDVVLNK